MFCRVFLLKNNNKIKIKIKIKKPYFAMNWTNSGLFRPISDRIELNRPISRQIEIEEKKKKDLPWKRVQLRQQPHGVSMCVGCGCASLEAYPCFSRITHTQGILSQIWNLQVWSTSLQDAWRNLTWGLYLIFLSGELY